MHRISLFAALLYGACTLVTKNLVVERCDFEGIRCSEDLQAQLECVDGVELLSECEGNLICALNEGCVACGNNEIDADEQCDGDTLPAADCEAFDDSFDNGELSCNADCTLNTDQCSRCGDGVVEGLEECDADNNDSGCLSGGCVLLVAPCNQSGDQVGFEICDGQDLNGQSCETLGFVSGTLQCNTANFLCGFDTSECVAAP